jgi:3'-phosphoadenosine 5'-phosphosulfate sulfotransferase (PAPS reductase)/FAD synthetase
MAESNPFLIQGPAVISFSGGRTSAYMLHHILQAHHGTLPDDVLVCFANTGREMPATLDFVRDCGANWNVPITWLEYRWQPGAHGYEVVNHNSASRNGEPFEMMLAGKSMLPNPVMRFCTTELKIRTMQRWVKAELGWTRWDSVVGLRADEMGRVERLHHNQKKQRNGALTPLADAGVSQVDVLRFWKQQPFNLRLAGPWEGNCDGCFLKSRAAIARMMADHPLRMEWWQKSEKLFASTVRTAPAMNLFRKDREDYATMARVVRDQGVLPMTWFEAALPCTSGGCGV